MAQENITVTLSGDRTAVIRSFVKNKDRRKIQRAMLAGKEYTSEELEAARAAGTARIALWPA